MSEPKLRRFPIVRLIVQIRIGSRITDALTLVTAIWGGGTSLHIGMNTLTAIQQNRWRLGALLLSWIDGRYAALEQRKD